MSTRFIVATIICLTLPTNRTFADGPFVAAFDRFARHGDIENSIGGRLLLSELSCTACHLTKVQELQPKGGPNLDGVGNRAQPEWLKKLLDSPQTTKPGTTMPHVLASLPVKQKKATIEALAAFLSSLRQPYPELKANGATPVPLEFWKHGNVERGRTLYHQIGCVSCHEADDDYEVVKIKPSPIDQLLEQLDPDEIAEMGLTSAARRVKSVPHGELPTKYTDKSLTFFLLNPEKVRPSGRMPNFQLDAVDASDISAYLLRTAKNEAATDNTESARSSETINDDVKLVARGRKLFVEMQCANCHSVTGLKPTRHSKPLASLQTGSDATCFGTPQPDLPHFEFDELAGNSVIAALTELQRPTNLDAAKSLNFRMLQLNCYACHERNKQGGVGRFRKPYFETVGHVDIGDEGRLPPPLTGVGQKLTTSWMRSVFDGKAAIRPHMHFRMPQFPKSATRDLPDLFVQTAGDAQQPAEQAVFPGGSNADMVEAGRQLMDAGCVQCHSFKGNSLPGTVGVDLAGIANRVHPKWFYDFLLNPGELKARTRMPTFFPNGKSQNKDLLNGDTEKQIAAMWAYLRDLDRQPLPEKIIHARNQNYELTPTDRPIVLRTFMKSAGTHAIAVGFPQKVHFAFDAEQITLAQAWRGRFLDAEGTWFVRFAPPADPIGDDHVRPPGGVPFAILASSLQPWPTDSETAGYRFRGYRLSKDGVPTFLYRIHQFDVEDRIQPSDDGGLVRRFKLRRRQASPEVADRLHLRAHFGKALVFEQVGKYSDNDGMTVSVNVQPGHAGELRNNDAGTEWIIPLEVKSETQIKLRYSW
ncbi:MAG TPA: c-type cytochrome [Fuerstia sp.]|nr:c-type cytochrome [Fuerstiella sp.]